MKSHSHIGVWCSAAIYFNIIQAWLFTPSVRLHLGGVEPLPCSKASSVMPLKGKNRFSVSHPFKKKTAISSLILP